MRSMAGAPERSVHQSRRGRVYTNSWVVVTEWLLSDLLVGVGGGGAADKAARSSESFEIRDTVDEAPPQFGGRYPSVEG